MERRLAAIMAADVVGYSRLVEQDEAGTLLALKERRRNVLSPLVAEHHGRIVKVMGDGVLVEFASAVNAVACAVELQKRMATANNGVADDLRILLRLGINLGDVVVEGGDLYGDGVIIAVRLQAMSEPGGICVSGSVHEQVGNKLPLAFIDRGSCEVKNTARPVRVFQVVPDPKVLEHSAPQQPTRVEPSIAVLPFTNLSGDPEQQYFSDGITEDIITELSRFRQLFVVARHSSFQFRNSAADVKHVGRELGVRYVVEGSVRRLIDSIRITAQLIDTTDGAHLWAERYDRSPNEIFAMQDEVVQAIVRTFAGRLEFAATERAKRRPTNSLAAYDCFLRAHEHMWRVYYDSDAFYSDGTADARRMCERALQLDPRYARAHACLGIVSLFDWFYGGRKEDLDNAVDSARTAVGLDDGDGYCHAALGSIYQKRAEYDLAEFHLRKAVALNPNDADTICFMGIYLSYAGQPLQAIEWLERAMRRNPFCPDLYYEALSMAHYLAHQFENGIASSRRIRKLSSWGRAYLAACLAQLGRLDAARAEISEYTREAGRTADMGEPGNAVRLETHIAALVADLRSHKNPSDVELWLDGLRKAGLPV